MRRIKSGIGVSSLAPYIGFNVSSSHRVTPRLYTSLRRLSDGCQAGAVVEFLAALPSVEKRNWARKHGLCSYTESRKHERMKTRNREEPWMTLQEQEARSIFRVFILSCFRDSRCLP